MPRPARSPLVLVAGPTATGKTALAVALARKLGGEIISADSMQVYRGCAVGAAQPTDEELQGVPCHLVGCVEPDQTWSVADWLRAASKKADEIHDRGAVAIVAGGTGLYFKALTEGLFETSGAERDPRIRRDLEERWDADGGVALSRRLEAVDPEAAGRIHANDRLRVVRALEVYEATGWPVSQLQAEAREAYRPPDAVRFVLTSDRETLYRRIDQRVEEMMENGFVEEVEGLVQEGAQEDWPAMRALGYLQMMRLVRGEATREAAVAETQRLSRRYAKQQMVLFRNWAGAVWLDAANGLGKNREAVEIVLELGPPVGV